jgi:hypothetical protein
MIRCRRAFGFGILILVIAALSTPASAVSADFVNDGACGGPLCNVDNPCTGCETRDRGRRRRSVHRQRGLGGRRDRRSGCR